VGTQGVEHRELVAGELEIDVELDPRERRGREVREPFLQRVRRARRRVLVVVREHEPAAALRKHVELDHVDAGRQRRVEAGVRVAGRDQIRPLVSNPPDPHRAH
jgi:hypothetical protein